MKQHLIRGAHILPHMSQVLSRDLDAEEITRKPETMAMGYRLTAQQVNDRIEGKPGTGLPYRYLIYAPEHPSLNWTAFYTWESMINWANAYGIMVDPHMPAPGQTFWCKLPSNAECFLPLCEIEPERADELKRSEAIKAHTTKEATV